MTTRHGLLTALSAAAVLLALLSSHKDHQVAAWGNTGHTLTGRLAMHLLSDTTKAQLKQLLPNVDGDISLVSSWADKVKRLPRYSHTGPLHYSDAHDDPPYACSYIFKRDCPDGNCVIAGIRNFTSILQEHRKNLLDNNPDAFHTLTIDDDHHKDSDSANSDSEYDDVVDKPESADESAFPITNDLHPNPAYLRHQVQTRDLRLFSDLYHSTGIRSRFAVVAKRRNRPNHGNRMHQQRRRRRRNRRRNRNRNRRNRNPGGSVPPKGPQKPTPPTGPPKGFVYTPQEAIKFLVHLVQDVHQPLHVSGREKGGNGAEALFDGEHVNLHIVWDSKLLEKAINDDYGGNMMYLADVLLNKMRVEWEPEIETWMTCPVPELSSSPTAASSDASTTPPGFLTPLDMIMCPEHWAHGVDQLNCNNVWLKYSPDKDLSKDYYKENIATVLKSVAMGGVRLAALLEAIFNPDRI